MGLGFGFRVKVYGEPAFSVMDSFFCMCISAFMSVMNSRQVKHISVDKKRRISGQTPVLKTLNRNCCVLDLSER